MAIIEIRDTKPSLREEDVVPVENKLGIKLPAQYREFLLVHNGGRPKPNLFKIQGKRKNNRDILDWFHCIHPGNVNDIVYVTEVYQGRLPPGFVPIGHDPFGNLLCLASEGPNTGKVYFWDHEEEGEKPGYENVYLVAENFNDFLNSLTEFIE